MMLLRPAAPRDLPRLRETEKAARLRYRSAGRLSFVAETPPIAASRLAAGAVVVAEEDGRPVGFVLMSLLDGMLYVANISVDPGRSGRGIGAALIAAAERHAIAKGLAGITLTTFRTPRWNAPWFRWIGFRPMPAALIGPSLRAILERHRRFLDMRTRVTLWRPIAGPDKGP